MVFSDALELQCVADVASAKPSPGTQVGAVELEASSEKAALLFLLRFMEVVNPRAAFLSNYEVLTWLRELESDHIARTKTALRVKKEEEAAGNPVPANALTVSGHLEATENLRTVEVEAIGYLASDYQPTSQTEESITKLVKSLAPYDLTKAEKLQIVNLAPTKPVELYVIVEELEDRFGTQLEEILGKVQSSLSDTSTSDCTDASPLANGATHDSSKKLSAPVLIEQNQTWDDDADAVYDEEYFDDGGAGVGVEGDLDMEED